MKSLIYLKPYFKNLCVKQSFSLLILYFINKISFKFAFAIVYISNNFKFLTLRKMKSQLNTYVPIFIPNTKARDA